MKNQCDELATKDIRHSKKMRRIGSYWISATATIFVAVLLWGIAMVGSHASGMLKVIFVIPASGSLFMFSHFAYADRKLLLQSVRSTHWSRTEGVVIDIEDHSVDITYHPRRPSRIHEMRCLYEYRIDGHVYRGNRYSFGGNVDQSWPDLSPGETVSIYFDKDNPSQSVARRGLCPTLLVSPILALASLVSLVWIFNPLP